MKEEAVFNLPCSMSIQSIAEIRNILFDLYRNNTSIIIDCSRSHYYDISALQLLVSVRKSAITKGLDVRLSGVTGTLSAALMRAGIPPAQLPDSILINGV